MTEYLYLFYTLLPIIGMIVIYLLCIILFWYTFYMVILRYFPIVNEILGLPPLATPISTTSRLKQSSFNLRQSGFHANKMLQNLHRRPSQRYSSNEAVEPIEIVQNVLHSQPSQSSRPPCEKNTMIPLQKSKQIDVGPVDTINTYTTSTTTTRTIRSQTYSRQGK